MRGLNNVSNKQSNSSGTLYGIAIAAALLAGVALFIWNSGIFQNSSPAATINGEKYSAAEVNYYYGNVQQYQAYLSMMGMSTFDYNTPAKDQIYDAEAGTTWQDYMREQAVESLRQDVALADLAQKAGFTLSEEGKTTMENSLSSLEVSWVTSGYPSLDAYLKAVYGQSMNEKLLKQCLERSTLANEYYADQTPEFTYEQAELDAYYAENKNDLDTFVVSQFLFQATVPTPTTNADGEKVELTDEEKAAALETAKAEKKALAEALLARLEEGEEASVLLEEFADDLGYSYASELRLGASLNTNYADWAYTAEKGASTLVEYQGSSADVQVYCVARIEDRYLDNDPSYNVRNILVSAGSDPDADKLAEAETKAQELQNKFLAGEKTEDAFAALIPADNEDTSIQAGGLKNLNTYAGSSELMLNWAKDPARVPGETAILKDDGSYTKSYQLMYFVGQDDAYWAQMAHSALQQEELLEWEKGLFEAYPAETGKGISNVG